MLGESIWTRGRKVVSEGENMVQNRAVVGCGVGAGVGDQIPKAEGM